jgi:iron(III) transport system ATP-binding protein
MIPIRLQRVSKRLGQTLAIDDIDLAVEGGELFFLLGPSGCGKTTLLNLVAGLIEPTRGRILFGDRDVTSLPTHQRNAVMCFQSYALWPHLNVLDNVRFGLSVRRLARAEQEQRAREALDLVRMSEYAQRKPAELSGGQQQRVAIARAVAVKPACLLLDEPLSNLDTRLRQQMRGEIRAICRATGLTTLYVTHDQKEALSIADRIAIMKGGRVIQVGTPAQLYTRPETSFVAEFLGQSNLIPGRVLDRAASSEGSGSTHEGKRAHLRVETALGELVGVFHAGAHAGAPQAGAQVVLSIRPEQVKVAGPPDSTGSSAAESVNRVPARLVESSFLGDSSEHRLVSSGQEIRMQSVPPRLDLPNDVWLSFAPADLLVLDERPGA